MISNMNAHFDKKVRVEINSTDSGGHVLSLGDSGYNGSVYCYFCDLHSLVMLRDALTDYLLAQMEADIAEERWQRQDVIPLLPPVKVA